MKSLVMRYVPSDTFVCGPAAIFKNCCRSSYFRASAVAARRLLADSADRHSALKSGASAHCQEARGIDPTLLVSKLLQLSLRKASKSGPGLERRPTLGMEPSNGDILLPISKRSLIIVFGAQKGPLH